MPIKLRKANTPKREILGYHKIFKSMAKYWKSNHTPVFPKLLKIYGIKIKKNSNITIKEFNENKVDCLAQADPKIITKFTPALRKIDLRETEFVIISNVFACKLSIDLAILI